MIKKYVSLLLILVINISLLCGCSSSKNIDKLSYVVAIGLDAGETSNLKITFQIALTPIKEDQSSTQSTNTTNISINCDSIYSGITLLNSYLSKKANFSHCKAIIISEELATTGISEYIYTAINDIEIRTNANIIICKNNCEYFIKNSQPILEQISAKYYESIQTSNDYTGFTENVELKDFFLDLSYKYSAPYAILGAVKKDKITSVDSTTNYTAGTTPIDVSNNIETIGLAIFKNDKLIGELTSIESLCHLIISNKFKSCIISIPNPFDNTSMLDLELKSVKKTKKTVDIINNTPFIKTKIFLYCKIYNMDESSNYSNADNLKKIEQSVSTYLNKQIYEYLYKTAKIYNADIDYFNGIAIRKFKTWQDWENYNWIKTYRNSFFDVDIDLKLVSSYILLSS